VVSTCQSTLLDPFALTRGISHQIRHNLDEIWTKIWLPPYSLRWRTGLRGLVTGAEQRRVGAHRRITAVRLEAEPRRHLAAGLAAVSPQHRRATEGRHPEQTGIGGPPVIQAQWTTPPPRRAVRCSGRDTFGDLSGNPPLTTSVPRKWAR
jgi:hypothetical protein